MNPTHIHLVLNHFPIVGGIIGFLILTWSTISKNVALQKVAATVLVFMAVLAIPVFLTGEPAEHAVERLPGISESLIEAHEDAAKISFWLMMLTGVVALLALFMKTKNRDLSKNLLLATLFVSMVSTGAMAYTGYTGGKIRHTEISGDQTGNPTMEREYGREKGDD